MNNKIAFKGDGTLERGKRIIAELERLGGVNKWYFHCSIKGHYYFIDERGKIQYNILIPEGYTLAELPEEKTFVHANGIENKYQHIIDEQFEKLTQLKKENEELRGMLSKLKNKPNPPLK